MRHKTNPKKAEPDIPKHATAPSVEIRSSFSLARRHGLAQSGSYDDVSCCCSHPRDDLGSLGYVPAVCAMRISPVHHNVCDSIRRFCGVPHADPVLLDFGHSNQAINATWLATKITICAVGFPIYVLGVIISETVRTLAFNICSHPRLYLALAFFSLFDHAYSYTADLHENNYSSLCGRGASEVLENSVDNGTEFAHGPVRSSH